MHYTFLYQFIQQYIILLGKGTILCGLQCMLHKDYIPCCAAV